MSDIILKVPGSGHCLGCMFLEIDYMHNWAKCNLFNEKLRCNFSYGTVDESSITKCSECPTND